MLIYHTDLFPKFDPAFCDAQGDDGVIARQ